MKRHAVSMAITLVLFAFISSFTALTRTNDTSAPQQTSTGSCKLNLSGHWTDNGRKVTINQVACVVTAYYDDLYPCQGTPGTHLDFTATLTGNQLTGKTSACNYGSNHQSIELVPINLTASADGKTLKGTYHNTFRNVDLAVTLERTCACNDVDLSIARDMAIRELNSMTTGADYLSNINSLAPNVARQIDLMHAALCDQAAGLKKVDDAKTILNSLSPRNSLADQQNKIAGIISDLKGVGSCSGGPAKTGGNGLCPDLSTVEAVKGEAEKAVKIAKGGAQIADLAGDDRTRQAFADTAEALGHIPEALEKMIKLGKKCELARDLINAIDELNRAGCNSTKLAHGFDNLFRVGGEIGKGLDLDPVTKSYFDLLSRNQNFFETVSGELNPEQRWKKQFAGIDQYVPGGCH